MRYVLLTSAVLASSPAGAAVRTWYITPDGTDDAPTIQAGIDSAAAGDEIMLAKGVFVL